MPGARVIARPEKLRRLPGPGAARLGVDLRFLPGDPVLRAGMEQPRERTAAIPTIAAAGRAAPAPGRQRRRGECQQREQRQSVAGVVPCCCWARGWGRRSGCRTSACSTRRTRPAAAAAATGQRARRTSAATAPAAPIQNSGAPAHELDRLAKVTPRLEPVPAAGIIRGALNGHRGVRAIVEVQRIAEVVPVVRQPVERARAPRRWRIAPRGIPLALRRRSRKYTAANGIRNQPS